MSKGRLHDPIPRLCSQARKIRRNLLRKEMMELASLGAKVLANPLGRASRPNTRMPLHVRSSFKCRGGYLRWFSKRFSGRGQLVAGSLVAGSGRADTGQAQVHAAKREGRSPASQPRIFRRAF